MRPVAVTHTTRVLRAVAVLAAFTSFIALAGARGAATKNGVAPLSPKAGAAESPVVTFRVG